MPITLNGDTGITTPGLINTGSTTLINLTTTGNTILGDQSTDTLNVANGNLVLDASGNLGVGISSPTQRLHVVAAGGYNATFSENSANNVRLQFYIDANEAALVSGYNTTPKPITFYTGGGLRATLDTAGNLGLGTTPSAWGGLFDVIQMGTYGQHIAGQTNTADIKVGANNYYNGTNYVYTVSGIGAAQYNISGSTGYQWQIAGSGTAGNTITFTQAMTLDASGRLGLGGRTNPSEALDVQGNILILNTGNPTMTVKTTGAGNNPGYVLTADTNSWGIYGIFSDATDPLQFAYNGSERARISSDGNLFIGGTSTTTMPTLNRYVSLQSQTNNDVVGYGLYVNEGVNSRRGSLFLDDSTGLFGLDVTAGSGVPNIVFRTAGTEHVRILSSNGNVGIGRTDPPMRLSAAVAGAVISGTATIGSNMQGIQIYNTTTATQNNAVGIWFPTGPHQAGIASFRSAPDSGWDTVLAFYTHGAVTSGLTDCYERMRVDGEGNLLINTTSRTSAGIAPSGTLQVNKEIMSVGTLAGIFWENRSGGVTTSSNWYGWYNTGGTNYLFNGASNIASINGSSGAYTALSDRNKKKDFEDASIGLSAVMQLKPQLFRMLDDADDAPKQLGFVAQDVKDVIPQAYIETDVLDAVGNQSTYIGLQDRPILAALTKAIQELKAELDSVKSELATIKGAA